MAKRRINLDQGFVGMGSPEDFATGFADLDDRFKADVEDADIVRDNNGKKQFIIQTHKIQDADGRVRCAARGRVALLPSICEICGVELVPNYSILSESDKKKVAKIVERHKENVHYTASAMIINEDQMEPVQWPPIDRK